MAASDFSCNFLAILTSGFEQCGLPSKPKVTSFFDGPLLAATWWSIVLRNWSLEVTSTPTSFIRNLMYQAGRGVNPAENQRR